MRIKNVGDLMFGFGDPPKFSRPCVSFSVRRRFIIFLGQGPRRGLRNS